MSLAARFSRRARWAVPAGAVAAVGVVVAGSVLTTASAAPSLPARTPAQLIAAIAASKSAPSAFSGVIVTNSALGLPDLPGEGSGMPISSLLTGSATIDIWYARPAQLRLALPVPLGESDLRVDGAQAWLWDSQTNTATHILPSAGAVRQAVPRAASGMVSPARARARSKSSSSSGASSSGASSSGAYQSWQVVRDAAPTPQQVAQRLLAAVGPTTTVGVQSNVTIAGQPAYQLTLAPKSSSSLVGRVSIAVDASNYLPLRVQVFARGAASPAYQIGFTSISFARPAASNFAFTPPPGARVRTVRLPAGPPLGSMPAIGPQVTLRVPRGKVVRLGSLPKGGMWVGVKAVKLPRGAMRHPHIVLPKNMSKIERQHLLTALRANLARAQRLHPGAFSLHGSGWSGYAPPPSRKFGWYAYAPLTGGTFPAGAGSAARVIGTGWLSVAVLPEAGLTGAAGGEVGALLRAATPVHGSWGSGRLLRTSLLSVLITSDGKVLIGAVTPSVLYADAAQAK
jgi:outer membrane lipoprotein-sorting protein